MGQVRPALQGRGGVPTSEAVATADISEHKRLFGFKPSRSKARGKKGRLEKRGPILWKKECICLRDSQEDWKPGSEEKIELARMGLGLKSLKFESDGNAQHVHDVIMQQFPVLETSGGYTLLRLAENSHTMVEIEGTDSGTSVHFLKDILNQAKLYIRPLQKDITQEDVKLYAGNAVSFDV